jgi:hypothetical protein
MSFMKPYAVLFLALLASEVLAAKTETRMSPKTLEPLGFVLTTKTRDNGSILVTITRDKTKAHWPSRDGVLEIYAQQRGEIPIVWCRLEPTRSRGLSREQKKDLVGYEFIVSPKHLDDTWFTVGEVQTADGEEDGELVIGGGDYYRFKIADFVEKHENQGDASGAPAAGESPTRCGE